MIAQCPFIALKSGNSPWDGDVITLWIQKLRARAVWSEADLPESFRVPSGQVWAEMTHGGQLSACS